MTEKPIKTIDLATLVPPAAKSGGKTNLTDGALYDVVRQLITENGFENANQIARALRNSQYGTNVKRLRKMVDQVNDDLAYEAEVAEAPEADGSPDAETPFEAPEGDVAPTGTEG